MVDFGLLAAEICCRVWGTPANFNGFSVLAALLHGMLVGVSETLRRWTEGATYIRQGGHHVGHWFTFLVLQLYAHCKRPSGPYVANKCMYVYAEKWGLLCPFPWSWAGSPSNTMSPGPRPSSLPSGILVRTTVWPQCPNVTRPTDRQTNTQTHRQTTVR